MTEALAKDWSPLLLRVAAHRRAASSRGYLYWLVCAMFLVCLNLYAPGAPALSARLLASAMILISAASVWFWIRSGTLETAFMPIFAMLFAINYGLPIFILLPNAMLDKFDMPLITGDLDKALWLSIAGLLLTMLGYYGPWRRAISRALPSFALAWEDSRALEAVAFAVGLFSLVIFWISLRPELPSALRQAINLAANLYFLAVISLFILQQQRRLTPASSLCLWGVLIPTYMILGMSQGKLAFGVIVPLTLFITYATIRRRMPWVLMMVGFLIFCVLQPAKGALRQMVWAKHTTDTQQSEADRVESLGISVELGIELFQQLGLQEVMSLATERLAQIAIFVPVVQLTPNTVPYWHGDSYEPLLYKAIPRAIYPEKSDEYFGNEFGHRYNFIQRNDWDTSINLPQLVEFYANFGPLGVLIGSLLVGVFYRSIHDIFIHRQMGLGALVGVLFMMTPFFDFESNLSLVIGGVIGSLLSVMFFHLTVVFVSGMRAATSRTADRTRAHAAG